MSRPRRGVNPDQLAFEDLLDDEPQPEGQPPRPEPEPRAEPEPAGRSAAGLSAAGLSAADIAKLLERPVPTVEQQQVIEAPLEPLLVVAGAGSGKTETMAARVVWLVANGFVEPDQVLGLTFTRKAAGELADRIRARLRALRRRGVQLGSGSQPVSVSTYHAYAAALVADHGLRLGLEPGGTVLTEAGAWQLADELVTRWDGDMADVSAARTTVVAAVLGLAAESAEHLVDVRDVDAVLAEVIERVPQLPAELGGATPGKVRAPVQKVLTRLSARRRLLPIVEAYLRRKRELEVLDFGDQVALAARIAQEVPAVGAVERSRSAVVLLDEYQDTSHGQLVLLRSLFGGGHPVTAVGDPHQSIYGWRGASAGNLERFPHHFPTAGGRPAAVANLSTSWRNDGAILAAANVLAEPLRRPVPWAEQAPAVPVLPLAARPGAGAGAVRVDWHTTVEEEAAAIAEFAQHHWQSPAAAGRPSVAVLCRTRAQFPLIEAALRARGLPVEVVGLGGLLHVPEVADLRAALTVIHDPTRGDALMRLLTGAAWRIGAPDLDALGAWSRHLARLASRPVAGRPAAELDPVDDRSIVEALDALPREGWSGPAGEAFSAEGRLRLTRLAGLLRGLRGRTALALPDLIAEVERALLLDVEVAALPGRSPAAARAHLDAFAEVAAGFAADSERATLGAFLGWLTVAEDAERGLDAGVVEAPEDAVQILTVHAAKGLEWDVVAVAGLAEGTFPAGRSGRPPTSSPGWLEDLAALPYPLRGDADGLPEWRWRSAGSQKELAAELDAFKAFGAQYEVAEERRLAYVAVTRARRHLLLTGALWSDGKTPRQPSRFLTELLDGAPAGTTGTWAEVPADGAANPRVERSAPVAWPAAALPGRREDVQHAADLVRHYLNADQPAAGDAAAGDAAAGDAAADPAPSSPGEDDPWAAEVELLLAERDAVVGRRPQAVLPSHLSASRVVVLAADPAALAAQLRRPMPQPPSPQARRGSAFHAWLERRFGAAALVDIDELPGAADDADPDEDLTALQERFLASPWAQRMPEAVEVPIEMPLLLPAAGGTEPSTVVLRGRIDAVFGHRTESGAEGWEVVDWKTGSPPDPRRAGALAVQLAVYRLAWARLQQVSVDRVSAAFFYAATGETVRPVDLLDEADLVRLISSPRVVDG